MPASESHPIDVLLIGSGVMSANLGAMLKRLAPRLSLELIEVMPELAREASDGWNNAGTGHAGLCEISYTPARDNAGKIPVDRAVRIFEQFERSKQFWGFAAVHGMAGHPSEFIHPSPHLCFVTGAEDADFLRARHAALTEHHFFRAMTFTRDPAVIQDWAPLVMEGRAPGPVAATAGTGTEVDFGRLARSLCAWLAQQDNCRVAAGWKVTKLRRGAGQWHATQRCAATGEESFRRARFVFIGAGGGTLPLLQSAGLAEAAGLGGFPIGGQWLVSDEPAITARHNAKVYGVTPPSSPSLGAGHLDLRRHNGQRQLLYGPFASWTTRFLKHTGSWTDLPLSIRADNIVALLRSGLCNRSLVRYLVGQSLQSREDRMKALRHFFPNADPAHWRLLDAGIRVQTIKKANRGELHFGTEVFASTDRSLAALLGASPGASVSADIALEVIKTCLPHLLRSEEGRARMRKMIPSFDVDMARAENAALFEKTTREAEERLQLGPLEMQP